MAAHQAPCCPWDSPGKNTGVGCHFLLQCMKVKSESEVTQSCLTLSDPMDCSPPGSSVHGTFQAKYWSGVPLPSPIVHSTSSKTLSLAPKTHSPAILCYTFFITFAAIDESIDFENFVSKSSLRAVDLCFLPISVLQAQKRAGINGFHKHVWWMSAMLSQAHLDTPRWLYLKILNICKYLFSNKVTSTDSGL